MYDRGIRFVRDIVIDSNLFLSKTQIEQYTGKSINFIHYERLIHSVKTFIISLNLEFNNTDMSVQMPSLSCYANFLSIIKDYLESHMNVLLKRM